MTSAPAAPASPGKSEAALALEQGDFEGALSRAAADEKEAASIRAQVLLAQGRLAEAKRAAARLPARDARTLELRWLLARQGRDPKRLARTALAFCAVGDPTGRSCADAELYTKVKSSPSAHLADRSGAQIELSAQAPLPVARGESAHSATGWIIDTGASESVISSTLAKALGLKPTRASFPVGVAGGAARGMARLALLPVLKLGAVEVKDLPVLVMDMEELERVGVHGILSPQQAFDGYTVVVDFGARTMRVQEGPADGATPHAMTVPYLKAGFDLVVRARVGAGPAALFGLDTGMSGACAVASDYAHGLQTIGTMPLGGVGQQVIAEYLYPAVIALGEVPIGLAECARTTMQKHGVRLAGLLGNALWGDGVIVLDTTARTFSWWPRPIGEQVITDALGGAGQSPELDAVEKN